jgi:hypothetical protein
MSGPKSIIVATPEPITVLIAAAAMAAAAVAESHNAASELSDAQAAERDARQAVQNEAQAAGLAALSDDAVAAEARFEQLIALAGQLGSGAQVQASRPLRPQTSDSATLAGYVRGLQTLAEELQSILLTEAARQQKDLADLGIPDDLAVDVALAEAAAARPRAQPLAQRLLARIAHLGTPPQEIEALARELDNAESATRADLLASELRRAIQLHIEATQQQRVQEATALIIEQSLKDLGYQVEDVAETLFVQGGTVHFRRAGWGDYMVRLRVDATTSTANFNVLRATDGGNTERSIADHLAEDRWGAEFPALLKALEARGLRLNVTRMLAAGELPVQLVDRGKLPQFAAEESVRPATRLLARELK